MTSPVLGPANGGESEGPAWLRPWIRFWFTPIDPTGLGFMRICCGLLVFYTYVMYSYGLYSYLGPSSWVDPPTQEVIRHDVPFGAPPYDWNSWNNPGQGPAEKGQYIWSIYFHVQDPFWILVIHISILIVMLLFTVGLWTRVTSVLTWIGAIQYVHRLQMHLFGMDTMLMILLLYLMIGNSGAALSVDRWLERRRARGLPGDVQLQPSRSANFAIRLLQIHFCIIYLTSGASKLLGSTWWSGTALWVCLANYNFAPMRVGVYRAMLVFLSQNFWLWQIVLTASAVFTVFTETCFTFLVWNKKWRPVMVSCSVFMHLGIGLIMGLDVFSLFMLTMVLAFVPPDTIRAYLDQIGGRFLSNRAKAPPPSRSVPAKELVLTRP
ncbi:MAG TPA: HTTM domain-containing protein [Gemmataceae bacterium]|nr:HTTM domain-containing protein [Gemmataceae bacterium]